MKLGHKNTAHASGVTRESHSFSQVPTIESQRSQFNRSHGLKTTFDAGLLIPIFWDEALPGDTMSLRTSSFCRLATPIFPVMDNMFMDFFFFAVPNRLLWDNWEKFNGAQDDPGDSTDFLVPQMQQNTPVEGSLASYFGLPVGRGAMMYNSLHMRAYNMIFNHWFRDENLTDSLVEDKSDGPDSLANYSIVRRAKRHDYFTSCLPFTQKGTAVTLPIGSTAPVVSTGDGIPIFDAPLWTQPSNLVSKGSGLDAAWKDTAGAVDDAAWETTKLIVDLTQVTGADINAIRQAFQIQRLLERDARGGTRYTEVLKSHFGINSPDQRLQRPEYLGGGTSVINIHPVAATAGPSGGDPEIGTLAGFGTQSVDGVGFVKSFTEHCTLVGLVNVRADLTYQQGIDRMWSRQTRFDYYWPALSHLGEQAVLNKEIWTQAAAPDNLVFGYQERYAEYRHKLSRITGKLNSEVAAPLDAWHLALDFASLPVLNNTFIEDNPPIDRVIAVPSEPHFIGDFFFQYKCARPMPTFSVPGMIDHF